MFCFFCGGPAHPATGAQYSARVVACYSCVLEMWTWLRKRMCGKARGGKLSFYDYVGRKRIPKEGT